MGEDTKKIALPALLRKGLQAFRVDDGEEHTYIIRDKNQHLSYYYEPWQFFVLEVLVGCENFEKLASVFEDRFGYALDVEKLEKLFKDVQEKKLFNTQAFSHPVIEAYEKKKIGQPASGSKDSKPVQDEDLPAGVSDVMGMDDRVAFKGLKLFNPKPLLKFFYPLAVPFKYIVYLLPTLFPVSIYLSIKYMALLEHDVAVLFDSFSFIEHIFIGMVSVNLAVTIVTAFVAYSFRASVNAFCLVLYMRFLPRFMLRIGNVAQLSRRERLWLHSAPLLTRLCLFSFGILMWFINRGQGDIFSLMGLSFAVISLISFLISVNPLIKSNGYHLLATFADEPYLKEKAYKTFLNKLRRDVYISADSNILTAYAISSLLCTVVFIAITVYILGSVLKMQIGPSGIIIAAGICILLLYRLFKQFNKIAEAYERSVQFERWRRRVAPDFNQDTLTARPGITLSLMLKFSLLLLLCSSLFIPCRYETGGDFVILPDKQQDISSSISGIIKEVYFDGSESLEAGTPVARLDSSEFENNLKVYEARIEEQKAIIDNLKAKPRPEERLLALKSLEVENTRIRFSSAKLKRAQELYQNKAISLEELADIEKQYTVDLSQKDERIANLKLVDAGVAEDEIKAAEAKLQGFKEMRSFYQEQIEKSTIYMPFTGTLASLHLKHKIGSYLEKGEVFAKVENTEKVIASISVPEVDIGFVETGAATLLRPLALNEVELNGNVTAIAPDINEVQFGRVMQVMTLLDNSNGLIKSGMTGYAKIESRELPLWNILSMGIMRFIKIELWSWLP